MQKGRARWNNRKFWTCVQYVKGEKRKCGKAPGGGTRKAVAFLTVTRL